MRGRGRGTRTGDARLRGALVGQGGRGRRAGRERGLAPAVAGAASAHIGGARRGRARETVARVPAASEPGGARASQSRGGELRSPAQSLGWKRPRRAGGPGILRRPAASAGRGARVRPGEGPGARGADTGEKDRDLTRWGFADLAQPRGAYFTISKSLSRLLRLRGLPCRIEMVRVVPWGRLRRRLFVRSSFPKQT